MSFLVLKMFYLFYAVLLSYNLMERKSNAIHLNVSKNIYAWTAESKSHREVIFKTKNMKNKIILLCFSLYMRHSLP